MPIPTLKEKVEKNEKDIDELKKKSENTTNERTIEEICKILTDICKTIEEELGVSMISVRKKIDDLE